LANGFEWLVSMARIKRTLKERIYSAYFEAGKRAKRDCTNWKEVSDRMYWERLHKIMRKRYDYVG